jgi:hypothetical protein
LVPSTDLTAPKAADRQVALGILRYFDKIPIETDNSMAAAPMKKAGAGGGESNPNGSADPMDVLTSYGFRQPTFLRRQPLRRSTLPASTTDIHDRAADPIAAPIN